MKLTIKIMSPPRVSRVGKPNTPFTPPLSALALVFMAVSMLVPYTAFAGGVISKGVVAIGLNDQSNLIDLTTNIGIEYTGVGDGISPGCPCEGWGFSVNDTDSTGASLSNPPGPSVNYTVDSAVYGVDTATFTGHMTSLPGLSIKHEWAPAKVTATGTLFEAKVTISNATGTAVTALKYKRVMDWDIPPTTFSELVTHRGVVAALMPVGNLERAHDNGFASVDPLATDTALNPTTLNTDFEDNGPADHGSLFLFNFGDLADGASKTFSIFYGAAGSEAEADAFISEKGLEIVSYGQQNGDPTGGTPATFIFGFKGVGGVSLACSMTPPQGAIVGTNGPDSLVGTPDDDVIFGLGGRDVIQGMGGNDILCGGPGNDVISDGLGFILGSPGNNQISGGEGDDTLYGGRGDDEISGDKGNDFIFGGLGKDTLRGGEGRDRLKAFDNVSGNDTVDGGDDTDNCSADAGDAISNCP